ncbi:UNVERIFIED_CONTAM: hypothetical protein GTU68_030592, partial [Idotea baltica]|nr:hypothetical protein [Idotea baltica]
SSSGYSFSFGYIENVTKRRTQFIPQHLKSISQPGANTVVMFEILFSKSYIENVTPGALVSISNISYIRPSLRAFESLCRLPSSSLSPYILNPGDLSVYRNESKKGQYLVHQLSLNEVQKEAVINVSDKCVNGLDVPKISLIHGPPGTGKTRVIAALVTQINQLFKETPGLSSNRRILLCAPSNAVVDEMIIRLAKLKDVGIHINVVRFGVKQSMQPEVNEFSFDTKVKREFNKKQMPNNKSIELEIQKKRNYSEQATLDFNKAVKENQPENEINKKKHRMFELLRSQENFEKSCKIHFTPSEKVKVYESCKKLVLMKAEVVATTLTSCLTGSLYEVFGDSKVVPFSCCIVDEAGQCKETETWFPLQLGIKKLILVGDHLQLPATVLSQLSQGKKLHQSLFQRIYHHIGVEMSQMDAIHSLNVQYRMHEEILAWPSMQFYDNTLTTASGVLENRRYALKPYIVFDVTERSCEDRGKKGEIYNLTEVHLIRSLIEAHEKFLSRLSIGILTPYQQQKSLLLEKLDRLIKKHKITVSTVDNFQGKEKDIIYCSFVRSNAKGNIGFVSDRQRLNVALTRARKSCFIVGDISSLQSNGGDWQSLVENARRRSLVRSVNKEMIENKELLLEMSLA